MLMRPLLTVVAGLACVSVHAGTSLETVNRDLGSGKSTTILTWAQNGMMRVESKSPDGVATAAMIFKDDTVYSLNAKDKTYSVMDRAAMKRMAEQINPMLKQMQERMAQMSPEQRAQMEKMMGNRMPGMGPQKKQEMHKTGRSGKVSGYNCSYVEVHEDGVLSDEMCVVPAGDIKGSQELLTAAKKFGDLMKEMMASIDAPWLKQMADRQVANFEQLGGVPVQSRHFSDGKPASETTLQTVRSESLAAALFEIPAGYTRKDMMPQR
jgi:hypothetical protein